MKNFFSVICLYFGLGAAVFAQQTEIKGTVVEGSTNEPVVGANVLISGTSVGTTTDVNGAFSFKAEGESGEVELLISFVGFETLTQTITLNGGTVNLGTLSLGEAAIALQEVNVIASVAIDRKTPVAVSSIKAEAIQLKLGNQEFPEILRSTPSVYATKQGGGFGDSRINVRGFDQSNVAVMINGIPVNDMENGWVYWSNWAGLSDVTSSMQVQRGLGASKLAVSSVGGTINIITNAADLKKGGSVSAGFGNNGYMKYSIAGSTGMMKNGWAVSVQGTRTSGDGYVPGTKFLGYSYFASVTKKINDKHMLSLTVVGAPQWHNQRSFANTISDYKKFGNTYNSDWGKLAGEEYSWRKNFYHKPKAFLNHYWTIGERTELATSFYYSVGNGGGTGPLGRINGLAEYRSQMKDANGLTKFDDIVRWNKGGNVPDFGKDQTPYTSTGAEGEGPFIGKMVAGSNGFIRRASMNNHTWIGLLSNLTHEINDNFKLIAGIDARYYKGEHFRQLDDLMGNDAYLDRADKNYPNGRILTKEESSEVKLAYHNDGLVKWLGGFAQLEYSDDKISAFVAGSLSNQGFERKDYFNYLSTDPDKISDWQNFLGGNLKAGVNYNLNEYHNIFVNGGYYSRQPIFDNVFINFRNDVNPNAHNETIWAAELGYGLRLPKFAANVNLYHTNWTDRNLNRSVRTADFEGTANMSGIAQVHQGIEVDFTARPNKILEITGMLSLGNWTYGSDVNATVFDIDQVKVGEYKMYLKDVKVGDAAQTTMNLGVTVKPAKGLRISGSYYYADRLYADYNLGSDNTFTEAGKQAWQLPAYSLMDLNASYSFKMKGLNVTINTNLNNVLDEVYISESDTNLTAASDYERNRVYWGFGRTWNMGLKVRF